MDYNFWNTDINIICITETWYKSALDDNVCNLESYSIFRPDRDDAIRGGGIAIYYRKVVKPAMVMKSTANEDVEFLGRSLALIMISA